MPMSDFFDIPDTEEEVRARLSNLRSEHQTLDNEIDALTRGAGPVDFVNLQRLKKRKLCLKDMILKLESQLVPDIIA